MALLSLAWRLLAVLAIAWMVRTHHQTLMVQGASPILLSEVREFLPEAVRLSVDTGPRAGMTVTNGEGAEIGYAVRTMPQSRDITGYSGPTDALVVMNEAGAILGVNIRHSYDTPGHVEDVVKDLVFMEAWNGRNWEDVAAMTELKDHGIYGVSGATRTSEAMAQGITVRLRDGTDLEGGPIPLQFGWIDGLLIGLAGIGGVLAFVKHPLVQRRKTWIHAGVVILFGIVSGDLIAQSLIVGWAENGIPWRNAPGLVILVLAAFLLPAATGSPVYCTHLCPHGHLQRWLMKVVPARKKLKLPDPEKWSLHRLPLLLGVTILLTTFLKLPVDLAELEPFDAWLIKAAGWGTITVAIVGLLASILIPMAYCRFGCPTGALLELVRKDRKGFGSRDLAMLFLLGLSILFFFGFQHLSEFLQIR